MPERATATHPEDSRPAWIGGAAVVALLLLWALRDLVVLVGFAVLLAYALDPVVTALGSIRPRGRGMPRAAAAAVVMLVAVVLAGIALAWIVPQAGAELVRFVERAPGTATELLARLKDWANANGFARYVDPVTEMRGSNIANLARNGGGLAAAGVGAVVGCLVVLPGVEVLAQLLVCLLALRHA